VAALVGLGLLVVAELVDSEQMFLVKILEVELLLKHH
jgi:hypothetical protein